MCCRSLLCLMLLTIVEVQCNQPVLISADMQECQKKGVALTCDFSGSLVGEYELRPIADDAVPFKFTVVHVMNANIVRVTRAMCVDLSFTNVGTVRFLHMNGCPEKAYAITMTNSNSDRVPRKIGRLTLMESEIGQVKCNLGVQRIFAQKSSIGTLDTPWPIGGSAYLRIDSCTIDKLAEIVLQERVTLLLKNSTVKSTLEQAVRVGDGCSLTITGCTFLQMAPKAIVLKSGAKFIATDVTGKINVVSSLPTKEDIDGHRAPGVPPKQPLAPDDEKVDPNEIKTDECIRPSPITWFLPTFIATMETALLFYIWNNNKKNRCKQADIFDTETAHPSFNTTIDRTSYQQYPSPPPSYYEHPPETDFYRRKR